MNTQADGQALCLPCRTVLSDGDWGGCDHTPTEINLAMALAHWVADDPEIDADALLRRACGFLDDEAGGDARAILDHLTGDETTVWTIGPLDDFAAIPDIETAFTVNGVGFLVPFAQEGPGYIRLAETWRPDCEWCDQKVLLVGDELCPECMAMDAAETAEEEAIRGE